MAAPMRNTQARRARLASSRVILGSAVCVIGIAAGCLNPMPDDFPSNSASQEGENAVEPTRDTCAENSLLVGCPGFAAPAPVPPIPAAGNALAEQDAPDAGAPPSDSAPDSGADGG